MARSKEYPDLPWVPPKAFGRGRDGKAVRYIVIHYTAGSEGPTSAEDGAAYNQRRTDGTSAHYFVDRNSVIHCVETKNRANCARHRGNRLGIQYELCGTAQTRAQWLDAASKPTLLNAAKQVARDCRKYDIPIRRLSVAQTRAAWTSFPNGPKGIVGHVDCTEAYPEDQGDHTDPGKNFPWDLFLDMVRDEMEEDDDMAGITQADFNERMDAWWNDRMKVVAKEEPSDELIKLRRAPWNQVVDVKTGDTMYQLIFRAAATYPVVVAMATALQALVDSESADDATNAAAIQALRVKLDEIDAEVEALSPPVSG